MQSFVNVRISRLPQDPAASRKPRKLFMRSCLHGLVIEHNQGSAPRPRAQVGHALKSATRLPSTNPAVFHT